MELNQNNGNAKETLGGKIMNALIAPQQNYPIGYCLYVYFTQC
jgi:hypothetical protein